MCSFCAHSACVKQYARSGRNPELCAEAKKVHEVHYWGCLGSEVCSSTVSDFFLSFLTQYTQLARTAAFIWAVNAAGTVALTAGKHW